MLIDTHCHLNLKEHFPDPASEVEHARSMGVERIVVVGIDLESSRVALDLADRFEGVFATVGIHPNHSAEVQASWLRNIEEMLSHPKAVALGEIGLDFHWDFATQEQQEAVLHPQLDLADRLEMPVVFHCREAYPELLDVLEPRAKDRRSPWVLHCFSGTAEDAQRAIAMDCYFGVDGPLTYKNAESLRQLVATLPRDRVVVETDAPYLTPVPHRGKPNRPGYVSYVNSMLASLWQVDMEVAARQTTDNANRSFTRMAGA